MTPTRLPRRFVMLALPAALAACATAPAAPRLGSDGRPLPRRYNIGFGDRADIQFRMLDGVNALRSASGAAPLQLNAELNAAAATHSQDMARQNRPWHFGSDGSSPIDRVQRVGYSGTLIGEAISETFETELETLAGWIEDPSTRAILLDPRARDLGFDFLQESNGKIWWTLVLGSPAATLAQA
ncbi:MAG: CAP domain-containing protein [Shimia sp.]